MNEVSSDAIRLKSLVFWLDTMQKVNDLSFVKRFWVSRDYTGFYQRYPVCPLCNGSPVFDPIKDGGPVVVNGITVDRMQCYCLTLKLLSNKASLWYESTYRNVYLSDIKPIDVPRGAAEVTASNIKKFERFLANPTRSALITGGTGTAKTHFLQSVKTNLGGFVAYITLADFFRKLMSYTQEKEGRVSKFIDTLIFAPILCLDDFGMQHDTSSGYGLNTLSTIINHRYERKRMAPTLMTTNLSLTEMQYERGTSIGNAERLLSRMMDEDVSTVIVQTQADYRLKPTRKEAGI